MMKSLSDLPEGHYIPDGQGGWKLKQAYHYKKDKNGEWYKQGRNEYHKGDEYDLDKETP